MDLPVPKDMDRRVLKEIFKKGSEPNRRKVRHKEGGEKGKLQEGIKGIKIAKKL